MLSGLRDMEDGAELLPFVSSFDGRPSTYLWEDEFGVVHDIQQGEGGEQGDALMPMLFSLGQHRALVAIAEQLQENEKLFAFLDDIYVVCDLDKVVNPPACEEMTCSRASRSRSQSVEPGHGLSSGHSSRASGARHDQIRPVDCEAQGSFGTHSSSQRFAVKLVAVDFLCRHSSKFHPPKCAARVGPRVCRSA